MQYDVNDALEILGRTPRVLSALLDGLPDVWVRANEGEDTWSAFDVVGHLIHGERTDWIPRARIILERGEDQPFEPFDRFAQIEENQGKSMAALLVRFAELRAASLEGLRSLDLSPENLERTGVHPEFGVVKLRDLLATWVAHDLGHIAQVSRVLAKQYRDEIGPWQKYLPIVQ